MNIRNSIKGLIVRDQKILFTKNINEEGVEFYILPGGGQNPGETMTEALVRECLEEISCRVQVENLVFVRDYIGENHEFFIEDAGIHQVEYMFSCSICEGETPQHGGHPDDPWQIGIEWISIDELDKYPIYPQILKKCLPSRNGYQVYLGDIN